MRLKDGLRRYERATEHEKWRPLGDPTSIVVGKNGLGWGIGVIATDDATVRSLDPIKAKETAGRLKASSLGTGAKVHALTRFSLAELGCEVSYCLTCFAFAFAIRSDPYAI